VAKDVVYVKPEPCPRRTAEVASSPGFEGCLLCARTGASPSFRRKRQMLEDSLISSPTNRMLDLNRGVL